MSRLLARIAAMPPGKVELQIHQVAPAFQISIDRYAERKNFFLPGITSARYNSGTKPVNNKKVSGETGQEAHSNMPVAKEENNIYFFTPDFTASSQKKSNSPIFTLPTARFEKVYIYKYCLTRILNETRAAI